MKDIHYNEREIKKIKKLYRKLKPEIKSRLDEFKKVGNSGDKYRIFAELSFCLMTPQSRAKVCWKAVEKMMNQSLLLKGTCVQLQEVMIGVRFKYKKSAFIVEAREKFFSDDEYIYGTIKNIKTNRKLRTTLIRNIKGLGYKESSHFLRNIGRGENLAILDRHILKNLRRLNIIDELPASCSNKKYLDIEDKMLDFSDNIEIPASHLDLLFWARETGKIFK